MKYCKYLLIAFIISVIFVAGCAKEEAGLLESHWVGGTEGIYANLVIAGAETVEGLTKIWEGDTFSVELELENKGEYTVPAGELVATLAGIAPTYGLAPELTNPNELGKITELFPGGQGVIDFGDTQAEPGYLTVMMIYTYPYETEFEVPQVCFKGDLRDTRVCNVAEDKQVFSSGAPIQVIKAVEGTAEGRKVKVLFDIINAGVGSASVTRDGFTPVYDDVGYEILSDGWECRSTREGVVRIVNGGVGKLECTLKDELPEEALYMKNFELKLKYFYEDTTHTVIQVRAY